VRAARVHYHAHAPETPKRTRKTLKRPKRPTLRIEDPAAHRGRTASEELQQQTREDPSRYAAPTHSASPLRTMAFDRLQHAENVHALALASSEGKQGKQQQRVVESARTDNEWLWVDNEQRTHTHSHAGMSTDESASDPGLSDEGGLEPLSRALSTQSDWEFISAEGEAKQNSSWASMLKQGVCVCVCVFV
jgi:hypothetical protein